MKRSLFISIFRKITALFLALLVTVLPLLYTLHTSTLISTASAAESGCAVQDVISSISARVGGVSLDQAAVFLADMSDITGAYYDADQDRIVFVGQKGSTGVPKFDKDDLAIAIRALVFNNQPPAVSMEPKDFSNPFASEYMDVLYYGGIEDTRFGKVLFDADYQLKIYSHGYDANNNKITSSVPGYKSFFDRYMEKGASDRGGNQSRAWISAKEVVVKRDSTNKSFVFDKVAMQVTDEALLSTNEPNWNAAATEFSAHLTQYYDLYADESKPFYEAKQLAKIVGVVKWIKDNNILNNFEWAKDYQPKVVTTPREIKRLTTPPRDTGNGYSVSISGGVDYYTLNTYNADSGTSSSLKNSSEAVGTPTEETHWTFTNNGQSYEAVSVAASAFRSLGAYSTASVDMSFPTAGDQTFAFARVYSSFSSGQAGIGRGWSFMPAKLTDNKPGWVSWCNGETGRHPAKVGLTTQGGMSETFSYTSCTSFGTYTSDKPEYHTKLFHNLTDGSFTATLTDQMQYVFDASFKLKKSTDKNGNSLTYNYDGQGRLASITDVKNHTLSLSYNAKGLVSSLNDWGGRSVQYNYDVQSNLVSVTDPKGGVVRYEYDANNKLKKVMDRVGNTVVENTYTADSKIATQKDSGGVQITYAYDEVNKLVNATDNNGRKQKVKYDDKARVLENTDPATQTTFYTYGQEYSPLSVTNKRNFKTSYTYDTNGNLKTITFPTLKKITYEYDTKNRLTRILDGRYGTTTKETRFTYDAVNGNLTQVYEAGRNTNFTYDGNGEVATLTDPNNQTTNWTRDSFGNPLTETRMQTNTTSFEYDVLARLTKKFDPENKPATYTYDKNSNIESETTPAGTTLYAYDAENKLQKLMLPNGSVTEFGYNSVGSMNSVKDAAGSLTSYGYDSYQNLSSLQNAIQKITSYGYDSMNRMAQETTPGQYSTRWEYDAEGNLSKRTDAQNRITLYQYDSLNRLQKITYPDNTTVSFAYDYRNNLVSMKDFVGTTTYTYDVFDRLTKVTNPFSRAISYQFDPADNLTKVTYPDNRAVTYGYDGKGRLTSVSDWNSSSTGYQYNKNDTVAAKSLPNGVTATYGYDNDNRISSLTYQKSGATLAKFTYERNAVGDIKKVVEEGAFFTSAPPVTPTPTSGVSSTPTPSTALTPTPTSGITPTPTKSITPTPTSTQISPTPTTPAGGKPDLVVTGISLSNPNPTTRDYFDVTVNFKNQGGAAVPTTSFRVGIFYDRASAPKPGDAYDQYETDWGPYDPGEEGSVTESTERFRTAGSHTIYFIVDNNLKVSESDEGNNVFGPYTVNVTLAKAPSWDPLGLLASIIPSAYAQTPPTQFTTTFTYDSLRRITNSVFPDGKIYDYVYDAADNIKSSQINDGSSLRNFEYDSDSRLSKTRGTTYSYDANGNMTGRNFNPGTQSYAYDFDDRLLSFTSSTGTTTTYRYDGLGNRLQKASGTSTTRYVNDISGGLPNVIAETNSLNSINNWFLYGDSLISQGGSGSSSRLYLLPDAMGNTRFVTNYNGDKVKNYDYDVFGAVRVSTGANDTNYRFNSQQFGAENSMYFLRARYYDPGIGRFITKDPVKGVAMMPQTMNSYAYSLNNPVNMSDPSGRFLIPAWIIAMWAIAEIGLTASDANDFANTLQDPNANLCDKAFSGALFAAGVIGPGGGYGKAAKILNLTIKTEHAARHLPAHLTVDMVEAAIKSDIVGKDLPAVGKTAERTITVGGEEVTYRVNQWKEGYYNVGTYFIK